MSTDLNLFCYVLDDAPNIIFNVRIAPTMTISDLKKAIKVETSPKFQDVNAHALQLWSASIPIDPTFKETIVKTNFSDENIISPWKKLSEIFPVLADEHVHVVIKFPVDIDTQPPSKRPRLDSELPRTPVKGQREMEKVKDSLPRFNRAETESALEAAVQPFCKYIDSLAEGNLDIYLDSFQRKDLEAEFGVTGPPFDPTLLHDLAKYPDWERIHKLFCGVAIHLFSLSGSGKTRLLLEGLCQFWGFYITCRSSDHWASGSNDFAVAMEHLDSMKNVTKLTESTDPSTNASAADRVFVMLLCARVFILKKLVEKLPATIDPIVARRRWVLIQVSPHLPREEDDIFGHLLRKLRAGSTEDMRKIILTTLIEIGEKRQDLFPCSMGTPFTFFAVIDEAQVAANKMKEFFCSETSQNPRPILREMYRFFCYSPIISGIILSGTGLSMDLAANAAGSAAKDMGQQITPAVFTDLGYFSKGDPSSQMTYFNRYLTLSDTYSDRRLMERINYWFHGRHRLTASLLELLLYRENVPRHRVLTHFIRRLTGGFSVTDAKELEESEPDISPDLARKLSQYAPLSTVDRLFKDKETDRSNLIQCLFNVVMRWTIGSETTHIPIANHMREIIALGIGRLENPPALERFKLDFDYPVYISEPLAILSLCLQFQEQSRTTRKEWITQSFCTAPDTASLGFTLENALLLTLVEIFGDQPRALADAFYTKQPWGSRKVVLVALRRKDDDIQICPVGWNTGSSDRFGFKAKSPQDVLTFLQNPDGKAFIFPDNHMGPDLMCFVQDVETKELIILALQSKASKKLSTEQWLSAVNSVNPELFYTMVDNKRERYAPVSYPDLEEDVASAFKTMLGSKVYIEVDKAYRNKLRSTTKAKQLLPPLLKRQTPRFLSITVTPDDDQDRHLNPEDGVLRWDVLKDYIGSSADVFKVPSMAVQ